MNGRIIDECLTEMQRSGSESAFEKLYIESGRGVYAFVYSYLGNRFDAEDVTQDTYILVRKNADKYESGTNAAAWLLEIAKNAALNFLNRSAREVVFTDAEAIVATIPAREIEPQDGLHRLISCLDEASKKIVLLHLVTGLKHREIACELKLPLGTVLWKYNAAVKKLREKSKEIYRDEE